MQKRLLHLPDPPHLPHPPHLLPMDRYATLRHVQRLDPERSHQKICHLLAGYEFPWDVTRALELARHHP